MCFCRTGFCRAGALDSRCAHVHDNVMKKREVVIPDHVLAQFPEEERELIAKMIREKLESIDPANPPEGMFKLEPLAAGVAVCPRCDAVLRREHTATLDLEGEPVSDIMVCDACDAHYRRPAAN